MLKQAKFKPKFTVEQKEARNDSKKRQTINLTYDSNPLNFDSVRQNTLKTVAFLTAMRTPFAQKKRKNHQNTDGGTHCAFAVQFSCN